MKRWAAALGSLAVVCFLAACSSSVAGTSPASPGPFASQADQVMADLAAGNFTAVEGKFDPAMIKAAQAVPLQKAWTAARMCWARTEATVRLRLPGRANSTSNRYPSRWANGPGVVTITFNPSGTIAGLHCWRPPS